MMAVTANVPATVEAAQCVRTWVAGARHQAALVQVPHMLRRPLGLGMAQVPRPARHLAAVQRLDVEVGALQHLRGGKEHTG